MWEKQRKSERRPCGSSAKMHFGIGSLPRDCKIINVSDGGARIVAENLEVPAEFTIIMPTGASRQCRLVWRIGCEFGVEFMDRNEFRRRASRAA